jgi:hypothetical protein
VPDPVAGGGLQRGGAVPGREVGLGREAGDVADLDQQPGGPVGDRGCPGRWLPVAPDDPRTACRARPQQARGIVPRRLTTIGVGNGPGPRKETAFFCDVTLCADDAPIGDGNFALGHAPPGDGMHLVLQELLGPKQAAYLLLTGAAIPPLRALELGLVNEVLPRAELLPRAWVLARQFLESPPASRRLAHAVVQRPWRQRVAADLGFGLAHVGLGARLGLGPHGG